MADLAADKQTRALITPEGVDLRVRLANVSERAIALIADMAIIIGALIVLFWIAISVARASGFEQAASAEIAAIVWLLGFFLLRNFYFTLFECSPRAGTPGKRMMGLRVAARNGGVLSADAVVARNAMREIELYLPIGFLFAQGQDIGAVIILCGIVWCGIFVLFPLFNKDRLRAGDLIAGTWVIKTPKQKLMPDLASDRPTSDSRFVFTQAQLDVYGVKELQVLETVLRAPESGAVGAVAERIRIKIGWRQSPNEGDFEFLNAYYAALRRRLEQRLLLGVRKKDKFDKA